MIPAGLRKRPGPSGATANAPTQLPGEKKQRANRPSQAGSEGFAPGTSLKHYEIIRELGAGGMGRVYLARDLKLGRKVALKFVISDSVERTQNFLREARMTARCQHENIVVIHEVDEYEGHPFMALELLEGQTLRDLCRDRRLTWRRAVELFRPIVRALELAHSQGIVHRDLKPENVFVTNSGVIKVLDFGIAKLDAVAADVTGALDVDSQVLSNTKTQGQMAGTLPYMAPEQWGMGAVGPHTDFWALGMMLWELLAGQHPLEPITPYRLMYEARNIDSPMPRLYDIRPDIPVEFEEVVARCLEKRPERRFAAAAEILAALDLVSPSQHIALTGAGRAPFPGLQAFGESDASHFFGRSQEIANLVTKLREQALLAVVGPSGVGKSSIVRAGLIPALKGSDEPWSAHVVRPGRRPLRTLARLMRPDFTSSKGGYSSTGPPPDDREVESDVDLLMREPGSLGVALRRRARERQTSILLYVDQFEEIFTLVSDPDERRTFFACLAAVADDPSTPLRVVVSLRSDFLDRVSDDPVLLRLISPGLTLLPPPGPTLLEGRACTSIGSIRLQLRRSPHHRPHGGLSRRRIERPAPVAVRCQQAVGPA